MQNPIKFCLLGFVILLVAGCDKSIGINAPSTDVAQLRPTFTLPPTETPFPTETPEITVTPLPTETPTPDENLTGGGADLNAEQLALTLIAENALLVAQEPTMEPLFQTMTALAVMQNPEYEFNPLVDIVESEPDPNFPQEPTLDEVQMLATSIIRGSTQTAEAPLTLTALLFVEPTAQPTQEGVIQPTAAPLQPGADCIHEVRATDRNLYRIAMNYGLMLEDIARASGIANMNRIYVGQRLTIPGCGRTGAQPLPTSTPNTGNQQATFVAQDGGGSGTITINNGIPAMTFTPIPPGQPLPPGGQASGGSGGNVGGRVHVVRQGESLFQISIQYGVLVNDIAAYNGISNYNIIYIGQELVIP